MGHPIQEYLMNKIPSLGALALAVAVSLPAVAQQTTTTADPSLPGAQTAAAFGSGASPASGAGAAAAGGSSTPAPGAASSDVAGTPVVPATPSNAAIASDPTMATATPSAPAISSNAAGTSTPPTNALGAGPEVERDRGGFDIGWLGLLGLAGLLGMRRRNHDDDRGLRAAGTAR
jgi:MYXO-CTERM domain-containing protein